MLEVRAVTLFPARSWVVCLTCLGYATRRFSHPEGVIVATVSAQPRSIQAKHIFFIVYALLILLVVYQYEMPFLDSQSPARLHFAKVRWWLLPHGLLGAIALFIAPLQFSNRLRQRHLQLHRVLGRFYVAGVAVAAPVAVYIAVVQGPPTLVMAAVTQST